MVVSGDPRHRDPPRPDSVVVRTNLDLISQLEDPRNFVVMVVLAGSFAKDRDLASFLLEAYPGIKVVEGTNDSEAEYLET